MLQKNLIGSLLVVVMLGVAGGCASFIYMLLKVVQHLERLAGREAHWMLSPAFVFSAIALAWVLFMVCYVRWSRRAKNPSPKQVGSEAHQIPTFSEAIASTAF